MRTYNVRNEPRELVPDGYTVGERLVLAGAKIFNMRGDYLGYWHRRDIPTGIYRELFSELRGNWHPANYDSEAL